MESLLWASVYPYLLMREVLGGFMAKASSVPFMNLLGVRSQLCPGTGVMAMACSPGRETDLDGGCGV